MSNHRFPIRDIQFHEEGLRAAASEELSKDEAVAVAWHSTAIAYLQYGAFKNLPGPAAELEGADGDRVAALIEDYLIPATDSHGLTYFKHIFKNPA